MAVSRRRWKWLLGFLLLAGLAGGGRAWWTERRYRGAMAEIEAEILADRFGLASRKLETLLAWKPDSDGALVFLLGCCEQSRARNKAADEAWSRVPPGSAYSERAISARMRLLLDSGRLAAAEQLVVDAARDPRNVGTALLCLLVPTYQMQGRIDEAARLIEARWEFANSIGEGALEPAIKLVRLHIDLTTKPPSVESVRAYLDQAARLAPADDRVWLGRANLAIRTGAYGEAERWLDDCLRRRAEDIPVWRSRLDWGIATGRIDAVQEALRHLPAAEATPAQVHRLRAWLAADRGDVDAECRELERLIASDPSDRTALDRLARLAETGGPPGRAAELNRKAAEIDRLRERYERLHERKQPIRDAVEMAHLAEQLGRVFEARVFLTLAISEDSDRDDMLRNLRRLSVSPSIIPTHRQTLAEFLDDRVARD